METEKKNHNQADQPELQKATSPELNEKELENVSGGGIVGPQDNPE